MTHSYKSYPLSHAQKRLFILDQFDKASIAYNIPAARTVEGNLDVTRFEESFQKLIQRHESLRTSFAMLEGEPVQKVHKKVNFKINYLESTAEEADEIAKEFIKPFNLSKAPLLRVSLVKIAEDKHLMLFDMHHIISDGISMNILVKEFIKSYEGEELPELRIQYKDYSVWQNELYTDDFIKAQEDYWLDTFKDEIPVLNMPLDYARPPVQSFEGNSVSFEIDEELTQKLDQTAKENGSTLYMTLLAAFNILLSKYTGQEDIVVGSPIAGRPHADLENIVGMFVNTLAMRNYPEGEKTFKEFLAEVKENSLKAYENQDYQFEELIEKLDIPRDLSRNPLCNIIFALQNADFANLEVDGLIFTPFPTPFKTSPFDIILDAVEVRGGMLFNLMYCTKLFKKETMGRLLAHYVNILEQLVENPEIKLQDVDMLNEEERKQILDVSIKDLKAEEADFNF